MDKIISKDDPNGIIEGAVCELIFEVSDDLGIGLQAADDIVRATELYAALANECVLRDDYDLDGLKLILRKELVRSGKYPTVEEKPIRDFSDFVKTMKHEIVYNISMCNKLKLSLTQISLLVENIENLTINEGDSELVHDIYKLIERCVCYLDPIDIGNLDQIWWRLNSFVQTLLQHCEVFNVKVDDLTVDLIHDYLDNESPWRPGKDDSAGGNDDGQTDV